MLLAQRMGLFAQAGNGMRPAGQGGANAAPAVPDDALIVVLLVAYLVFIVIAIGVYILYLMTLSKALSRCSPANRTMEPGQVWLNLIPCFNLVWQFITVNRISESFEYEFRDRRLPREGDFAKNLGLTYLILNLCGFIPYIGFLFSIGSLVCWIIYWVKIAGFSKLLAEDTGYGRHSENERDRDYDDDRRRQDERDRRAWDERERSGDDPPARRDDAERDDDDYRPRDRR